MLIISSIVYVGQSLWTPSIMTVYVLIVLFVRGDSPYFCPVLFIFLLYQDPFLSSLERQAMPYQSLQEQQSQASFAGSD